MVSLSGAHPVLRHDPASRVPAAPGDPVARVAATTIVVPFSRRQACDPSGLAHVVLIGPRVRRAGRRAHRLPPLVAFLGLLPVARLFGRAAIPRVPLCDPLRRPCEVSPAPSASGRRTGVLLSCRGNRRRSQSPVRQRGHAPTHAASAAWPDRSARLPHLRVPARAGAGGGPRRPTRRSGPPQTPGRPMHPGADASHDHRRALAPSPMPVYHDSRIRCAGPPSERRDSAPVARGPDPVPAAVAALPVRHARAGRNRRRAERKATTWTTSPSGRPASPSAASPSASACAAKLMKRRPSASSRRPSTRALPSSTAPISMARSTTAPTLAGRRLSSARPSPASATTS